MQARPPKPDPDSPPPSAAERRAATLLGRMLSERYRIDEILAMGGMGTVYKGEHVRMRKRVAIKVLHPETENLPELAARFEREAIAGAHLEHPNIASATDFGRLDDGSYFLVLEYVRGITLSELIKAGPVPAARAVSIARQIAAALGAAHQLGIVHRDVKPRNVMLADTAKDRDLVKLIDFGLARVPLDRISTVPHGQELAEANFQTAIGVVFGTVAYMAPETALGMDAVTARSDLYALGIILYEMIAGAHPFDAVDPGALFLQQRTAMPPPIHERGPGVYVPRDVEAVVMRLLKKDPNSRFADAAALIAALDGASGGLDPREAVPVPTEGRVSVAGAVATSVPPMAGPPLLVTSDPQPLPESDAATIALFVPGTPDPPSEAPIPVPESPPPPPTGYVPRLVGRAKRPWRPWTDLDGWQLAIVGALALVFGLVASALVLWPRRGPATPAPPPPAESGVSRGTDPPPEADASAREDQGAADARARLVAASQSKQWARGVAAIDTLAMLDPASFGDHEVSTAVGAIAIGLELEGAPEADDVFGTLSKRLGRDGIDILYDMVAQRGGSKGAKRAADLLRDPEVAARGTPAARIAFQLRDASCKDKPGLFDRAAEDGDMRSLVSLEILRGPACRPKIGQCCFPKDPALDRAITAVRGRQKK